MSSHPNMWLRGLQIQINHDASIRNYRPRIIKSRICLGMWILINSALYRWPHFDKFLLFFLKLFWRENVIHKHIFFVVKLVIDRVLNFCSHSELNFLNRLQERVEQLAGLLFLDIQIYWKYLTRPGSALVRIIVYLHAKWCQ